MTNLLNIDPETRAALRGADPLRDPRVEGHTGLDTESALSLVLERTDEATAESAIHPGRKQSFELSLVATGAVAATVVAVNVGSVGHGAFSRALGSSGVSVAPAQAAPCGRIRGRDAAGAGGRVERSLTKTTPDATFSDTAHSWTDTSAPYDNVT